MRMENLNMPPLNTTLMGVLRGVLDYYALSVSTPLLYGGSGHAFLMNIHEALCPSGPYCWNPQRFVRLVRNLGIEIIDHGFFSPGSPPQERAQVEETLVRSLDGGIPCSLLNMENQLITGYDETGFLTAQPWGPDVPFTPKHLTFGTWEEFGDEVHVNYYSFRQAEPVAERAAILDSLDYAIDLYVNPTAYTQEPYGVGPDAYAKWVDAVNAGEGSGHGNWWNATVWAECRAMACDYLNEIADKYAALAPQATALADAYGTVAQGLSRVSDNEMDSAEKIVLLKELAKREKDCITRVSELAAALKDSASD